MRKIFNRAAILIMLVLPFNSIFGQSGWFRSYNPLTINYFSTITRIDSQNYIAFTFNDNYYYRTSDGGINWDLITGLDTICTIKDCEFINSLTGWCVGNGSKSVLFKTTNGGYNWDRVILDSTYTSWECIEFTDENTGWIGGLQKEILKTTNGGSNWVENEVPELFLIRDIKFLNNSTGWICGSTKNILKTTNGGLNWEIQLSPVLGTAIDVFSLSPINSDTIWGIGHYVDLGFTSQSYIIKTINGGINWNLEGQNSVSPYFVNIHFTDANTGYQYGGRNLIGVTTNGGLNWHGEYPGSGGYFTYDMCFGDSTEIFAAGGRDYQYTGPIRSILKSTNAGDDWTTLLYNKYSIFYDIHFLDINTGFFVGEGGNFFKTTNAGINWDSLTLTGRDLYSITFTDAQTGYISGDSGKLYKTTNTGENWNLLPTPYQNQIKSIFFVDNYTGWIGGGDNKILKTTNGGADWISQNVPQGLSNQPHNFVSMSFVNSETGYVSSKWTYVGHPQSAPGSSLSKTTNGGNTWNIIRGGIGADYNDIFFLNSDSGFLCSKYYIDKTIDGGQNWSSYYLNRTTQAISFYNNQTGWLSSTASLSSSSIGRIYKTTNGGNNWYEQNYSSGIIKTFHIIDANAIWTSGYRSSIYKTIDGGGPTGVTFLNTELPKGFSLHQNYPNPFNPSTKIKFDIPEGLLVKLRVYDILGREVAELVNEKLNAGVYEYEWNGNGLTSGVYFYRLQAGEFVETKRMVMVK